MDSEIQKKIIVLAVTSFPVGLAGTNRIMSYCKGFIENGKQPEVVCIRPSEPFDNYHNTITKGNYNGIDFIYPGGITFRVASFWGRRKNDFWSEWSSLVYLFKSLTKKEISFVIFYGNHLVVELFSLLLTRIFKIKIYKEESENPEIYFGNDNSLKKWFVINKLYKYYDGVLLMTNPLKKYFISKGISASNIVIVPQTVDVERFQQDVISPELNLPEEFICYVGSLNEMKDGVLTLAEAFSAVNKKYPGIFLVIAGSGTEKEKTELFSVIKEFQLEEKIKFLGRISSENIPELFKRSKILVSCRPRSLQSEFGFPTKVAEYLATGIPVVTTSTGDLSYYLEDRVNAFVATDATPEIFSAKILEVLSDYDFALQIAQEGKKMAIERFNPVQQTKNILEYFRSSNC